jgi:ferredoxin
MSDRTGAESPDPQEKVRVTAILEQFAQDGFEGQMAAREGGQIMCFTCRKELPADQFTVEALRRMEGASDPADMLAVTALVCPNCQARGTVVLSYGPDATLEDSEALRLLDDQGQGTDPRPGA